MTNTALKAIIDEDITDKTQPDSLSNIDLGDRMKDIVDYTDQEVAAAGIGVFKTVKRVISHAELLTLFTAPITLLAAAAGKMYIPTQVVIQYNNNEGWGQSGGSWKVFLDATQIASFLSQMGGTTNPTQAAYALLGNPSNSTTSFFNKAVTISLTANPESPVSETTTVTVYLAYVEIIA